MPDTCIKRRLLFACRQTYADHAPPQGTGVGWRAPPRFLTAGDHEIDRVLVGRIADGIVVAFRGTVAPFVIDEHGTARVVRDWGNNAQFLSHDNLTYPGRVHRGFAASVAALWPQLAPAIGGLVEPGGRNTLFVTGHSKGGALAVLAAWRALGIAGLDAPIRVFTIAGARAGNEDFRTGFQSHGGIRCLRYEAALDLVPLVPVGADTPSLLRPLIRRVWPEIADNNYVAVGTRVPAGGGVSHALTTLRHYLRGFRLDRLTSDYLPLLASAHSIGAGSGYDQLVCDGEPGCTHG